MSMSHEHFIFRIGCAALVVAGLSVGTTMYAAPVCDFKRDLEVGVEGKDVLCLQQWLNKEGYVLAKTGPGAPGAETERFGTLTKEALARFQKDKSISPALGLFGPRTRALILSMQGGSTTPVLPPESVNTAPATTSLKTTHDPLAQMSDADRANAEALIALLESQNIVEKNEEGEDEEEEDIEEQTDDDSFGGRVIATINMIYGAEDAIQDGDSSPEQLSAARNNLEDAQEDLVDALYAYFKGKSQKAADLIDDASDNAEDAFRDAGGTTRGDEMEERLDDLSDALDDAWDTLDAREDAGDDIDDAEETLTEAEALLEDIEDMIDDGQYDDAEEYLDEVEDLIDDAFDAVVSEKEEDAKKAIKRAKNAIDDARDAIDEAIDDGDDTEDAEELLEDAEDLLEDAEDAFDDEDFADAIDAADSAEDRADSAVDEL